MTEIVGKNIAKSTIILKLCARPSKRDLAGCPRFDSFRNDISLKTTGQELENSVKLLSYLSPV